MFGINQLSGRSFGQYQLLEQLGRGGMGAVYRAHQLSLGREVAVKVLNQDLAQQADYLIRFTREAQIAAALEHPHIIPIYDYGVEDDISYVVMRYLPGGSLADRIESAGKLPPEGVIALLTAIAGALDYAHSREVLHRDIKPGNIMFDDHERPYLVDFGLAKLASGNLKLTESGLIVGTPDYMAPEQWRGDELTPAADQYALAVMAYELLAGQMPFQADSAYAMMHKHLTEAPPMPQAGLSEAALKVLRRGMAKNPSERYPTVTAFVEALAQGLGKKMSLPARRWTPLRPLYAVIGVLVLVGAMGVMALAGSMIGGGEVTPTAMLPTRVSLTTPTVTPTLTLVSTATPTRQPPTATLDPVAVGQVARLQVPRQLVERGDYRLALISYNRLIDNDPDFALAYVDRGLLYLQHYDNPREAIEDFNRALRLDPGLIDVYLARAQAHTRQQNHDLALDDLYAYIEAVDDPAAIPDMVFESIERLDDLLGDPR